MEAEPEVLAASVESTSEKKVWPELPLRGEKRSLLSPWPSPPSVFDRLPLPKQGHPLTAKIFTPVLFSTIQSSKLSVKKTFPRPISRGNGHTGDTVRGQWAAV